MIRRGVLKRTTTTAALIAAMVVLFAVLGAGGTYALWQDRYEVPPVTISSGSAELEVALLESGMVGPLFPGESDSMEVEVSNAGNSDLQVLAAAVGSSDAVASLIDSPVCAGGIPVSPEPVTIVSGEVRNMCLQISLEADSPNTLRGQLSTIDVIVDGSVGGWTAQDRIPVDMLRGDISIELDTWNGLLGIASGGVSITNHSSKAMNLTMENHGGGLLNLDGSYISPDDRCRGIILAPVLGSVLGGDIYDLGTVSAGGTVHVCMASPLGLGRRSVEITATYQDSPWNQSATSDRFIF